MGTEQWRCRRQLPGSNKHVSITTCVCVCVCVCVRARARVCGCGCVYAGLGLGLGFGVAVRVKVTCRLGSVSVVIREGWATRITTNGKTHVGDREIETARCINYVLGCVRGRVTGWRRVC